MTTMPPTDPAAFTAAVQHVSALAHVKVAPAWHSRLEMATALVLQGFVDFDADGLCHVLSSDKSTWYAVNGSCQCEAQQYHREDYWCKHKIARGLALKARALLAQQTQERIEPPGPTPESAPTPDPTTALPEASTAMSTPPLPEAPCSANVHVTIGGKEVLVTVRGHSLAEVLPQIEVVIARYPAPVSQEQGTAAGKLCPIHQVHMHENHKDGRSWWSHRHEGRWCKGK